MRSGFRFLSFFLILLIVVSFHSCEDFTEIEKNSIGNVDFSSVVAIGNSITAGFQDGALFQSGQEHSYPALIVKQINRAGGNAEFIQPIIAEPGLGKRLYLKSLIPLVIESRTVAGAARNADHPRPYNNLAIPGAVAFDIIDTTSFAVKSEQRKNPFFQIILRDPKFGKSMLDQAIKLNPTFVFLWIGNNDVLGYAASGGTSGSDPTGKLPTPASIFQSIFTQVVDALLSANPNLKMAVANIPDVTVIPYFTTIPWFAVDPNTGEPIRDQSGNLIPLIGIKGGQPAQLSQGDLVLLKASSLLKTGYGLPDVPPFDQLPDAGKPLPDEYILDADEVNIARGAIQDFNNIISQVVNAPGRSNRIVLVDVYSRLNEAKANGIMVSDIKFTTDYITGGLFSLDGVHPSRRGHAMIANEFINAINSKFGTNIALIDVMSIPGIELPSGKITSLELLSNEVK
jgi:lysophospholipase L1-like esterase